jgi:PAS domain S-box-containing protein
MGSVYLSGQERILGDRDIIVSKTDLKGRITYANENFLRFSGYGPGQILGAPHNIVRHPDMPRAVFKLLWDQLQQAKEIFAYVVNRAANGDHYWVLAHVTHSRDLDGRTVGYHSNRRSIDRRALEVVAPLYRQLLDEEARHANPKDGMQASSELLADILARMGKSYDEFIFTL